MNEWSREAPVASGLAPSRTRRLGALLMLALLLVLVHIVGLARDHWKVFDGELMGPDSYMRLLRVERLFETGGWYDSTMPRSNTPYGEVLHWSRPFDVVLLSGAMLLTPLVGFDAGLFASGVLVGPLLHFLTLLVLLWGTRGLLSRPELAATAVMFLFQASISSQFQAGRPDHHGLQALLFAALVALALRLLASPRAGAAVAAGLVAAGAIWVSVEGLPAVALVMATLAGAWLVRGGAFASTGATFAVSAAGGLALALAVERPPADWLAAEYDRASVAHLAALLAHAGPWLALWLWSRSGPPPTMLRTRAALALAGAALAVGLAWLLYPKLFAGPMVDVPVRVRELWLPQISEMMSIVGQADFGQSSYLLLLYFGAVLPASVYMIFLVRRSRGAERGRWLFLLLATLFYLGLGIQQLRWGIYAQLAALPAYGKLSQLVLRRFGLEMSGAGAPRRQIGEVLRASFARLLVLLIFALGFPAAALLAKPTVEAGQARGAAGSGLVPACDIAAAGRLLGRQDGLGGVPRRTLTYIFDGPELLYWTPHEVVATPYHRNAAGILDTYDFFAAVDPEAARQIVQRRGIEWVLLCPRGSESLLYRRAGAVTLLDRLRRDEAPAWLRPVALPGALGREYRLYEVRL